MKVQIKGIDLKRRSEIVEQNLLLRRGSPEASQRSPYYVMLNSGQESNASCYAFKAEGPSLSKRPPQDMQETDEERTSPKYTRQLD